MRGRLGQVGVGGGMPACWVVVEPSRLALSSQVITQLDILRTYIPREDPAHSSAGSRTCRSDGAGGTAFGRDEPNLG